MLILKYYVLLVLILSLGLSGCSDDDSNGPSSDDSSSGLNVLDKDILDDLVGTWEATQATVKQIDDQSSQEEINLIDLGGAGTLIISPNGDFIMPLLLPDGAGLIYTGDFFIENSMLTVLFDNNPGDTVAWDMQRKGNSLILEGRAKYDFIGDGSIEDALIDLDLNKSN